MSKVSYETVAPLVSQAGAQGAIMQCVFECPVTKATVPSQAQMDAPKASSGFLAGAKRTFGSQLRWSVSRSIRRAFGYSMVGRMLGEVASQVASQAMGTAANTTGTPSYPKAQQHAAIVAAFQNVAAQFVWDEKKERWISASAAKETMSAFDLQLSSAPVTNKYDRGVLARMLVEIARSDGRLTAEEGTFLTEFIGPDIGTIESLSKQPPLNGADLAEATAGPVRESMLLVAWVLGLVDEEFSEGERQRLDEFAFGLGIAAPRRDELSRAAQATIIEQALERIFTWGSYDTTTRNMVMDVAKRIGMERAAAERAEARYRKLHGIA